MKNCLTVYETKEMFQYIANKVIENEPYLTEIDNIIGDGDHGTGMKIGFQAVQKDLWQMPVNTVNELFKEVGMTMLEAMGGASGVIFGTMFISAYGAVEQTELLDLGTLARMFHKSLENILLRGKAKPGDKTMVDSFAPAVDALFDAEERKLGLTEGLKLASEAAKEGAKQTKFFGAAKGRAQAYGDLSIGTPDPGAVSVGIILEAMYEFSEEKSRRERE